MWAMSKRPVCRYFLEGSCNYGIHCRFSHAAAEVPPQLPPKRRPPQAPLAQGPPQAAWASRQWCTGSQQPSGSPRFRVMSYNVLADELAHSHRAELYRRTPAAHLDWQRRWAMICSEIGGLQPDLVCLQEVDHWQQVERDMQQLGYEGCYAQRSGGRTDGCATFWRSSCFESLAVDRLQFSDFDMRDNVGLLALLALKAANPPLPVAVANTHILFNPKRGDMKLGQLRLLLLRLQELLAGALPPEQAARAAALVMGDMNHQPATPVYQFMRHGWVDCLRQHRKAMAGGLEIRPVYGARSSSAPPPPPPRQPFQQPFQQQLWHPGSGQQQWQQQQQQQQWQQQQQQQQQGYPWGTQLPPPAPLWQQQQQQQQPRVMQDSASAPSLLTMRRLKNAGWSAEELITATGGAHGTHLLHFVEQHHEQQQQQQQGSSSDGVPAAQTGAVDGTDMDTDAAGDSSDQQHQQQAQTHTSAVDDGGSSSGKQLRKQQQQQFGHDQDGQELQQGPRSAGSRQHQQQHQQPVAAAAADEAAAAVERRHKQAWSALDRAQRRATKELAQAGGSEQQLAELAAAQQAERAQLKKQHKRERKQQQQQQDQPGGGVAGAPPAEVAAAVGVGRVPPGAPLAAPAASSAAGSQQQGQRQRPPLPPFFTWGREQWDEPLPASAGDGVARHGLQLRSVYAELTGSEPAFTSCHDSFFGTVDYVWYSPAALRPVAVLLPPCPHAHLPRHARCMPNASIPSDHVSLVCDFECF